MQERHSKSSETISELTNELGRVSEELEEVKRVLEERGSNISDTSPVVKIKEALTTLKVHIISLPWMCPLCVLLLWLGVCVCLYEKE